MSTFRGIAKEFPQIRIDYFRPINEQPPPLVVFLSHCHSDHLAGLDSFRGRFVYCSPATKEILVRLEKYPHRMNFAKGILESRRQTYKHLETRLRTIPLETPTIIELSTENEIRVTLFDANHCAGSSMFLIEGDGKAILYTGDIRSEEWWVNSLIQNPILVPYTLGSKRLDNLYLDTTFASSHTDRHLEFASKAEGLRELIEKVEKYPKDTVFYIEAWTFGYENVWIALSSLLSSPVHLDRYRWSIYKSLAKTKGVPECREGAQLVGFQLGNQRGGGCLTPDPSTRIHSCQRGTSCPVIEKNPNVVRIVPIVARLANGTELQELGIGGGKGDLDQADTLHLTDTGTLGALMQHCAARINSKEDLLRVNSFLLVTCRDSQPHLRLELDRFDEMNLDELVDMLIEVSKRDNTIENQQFENTSAYQDDGVFLPKTITFPYSRHSSYSELCALVRAFQPRDVYPCTVNEKTWTPDVSIKTLFGHLCSGDTFAHDGEMNEICAQRQDSISSFRSQQLETQQPDTQDSVQQLTQRITMNCPPRQRDEDPSPCTPRQWISQKGAEVYFTAPAITTDRESLNPKTILATRSPLPSPPLFFSPPTAISISEPKPTTTFLSRTNIITPPSKRQRISPPASGSILLSDERSQIPTETRIERKRKERSIRHWAYLAVAGTNSECDSWDMFGGLSCVKSLGGGEDEEL